MVSSVIGIGHEFPTGGLLFVVWYRVSVLYYELYRMYSWLIALIIHYVSLRNTLYYHYFG